MRVGYDDYRAAASASQYLTSLRVLELRKLPPRTVFGLVLSEDFDIVILHSSTVYFTELIF